MKKLLIAVAVLAVIAASLLGLLIYHSTHIFVEGAAYSKNARELDLRGMDISANHYETVRAQLPDCLILWDVPFQGGKVESNTKMLEAKGFAEADVQMIPYFTDLEQINVTGCEDYVLLEGLQRMLPDCQVHYMVDLGGRQVENTAQNVSLEPGSYDYETLMQNLKHLPEMNAISFSQTELDTEKFDALVQAYGDISFGYTVELLGEEMTAETTSADLTKMTSQNMEEALRKLPMLVSPTVACTYFDPAKKIREHFADYCKEHNLLDCTFLHGFSATDRALSSASVLVVADGYCPDKEADELAAYVWDLRKEFVPRPLTAEESIAEALSLRKDGYVVIKETVA